MIEEGATLRMEKSGNKKGNMGEKREPGRVNGIRLEKKEGKKGRFTGSARVGFRTPRT